MNHVLKSRHGMARAAPFDGSLKPPRLSSDDWRRVREERRTYPNQWDQQREANRVQRSMTGIARLGNGGKAHFMAEFKEVVGRAPTEAEYMEGRDNSLGPLLECMRRDGIAFTPRPEQRPGLSDHAIALDVEMDAEEEDQSYVPSDDEETEDEVMESETDQDIWLQDVEHPTISRRPKGRRWRSCKEINPETIIRARDNTIATVCLLEEHFPTSILNIQVHLLVHLVDEVEIAGTVHARWMFFLERFMTTLKGFVRQRA
ncbi:hypothetical protein L7F22_057106 [Adiantum nelumboides]|nr:hypothetical protein [Adiantum nelumboides]